MKNQNRIFQVEIRQKFTSKRNTARWHILDWMAGFTWAATGNSHVFGPWTNTPNEFFLIWKNSKYTILPEFTGDFDCHGKTCRLKKNEYFLLYTFLSEQTSFAIFVKRDFLTGDNLEILSLVFIEVHGEAEPSPTLAPSWARPLWMSIDR